jgi:hypothetical protein
MLSRLTFANIICNAFDKNYSVEQAAIDLGELISERELIKRRYGTSSPRLSELEKIIPVQVKLAMGKLSNDQLFDQMDWLAIRLEKHD